MADRVIEPEIKFLFLILVVFMFFAKVGGQPCHTAGLRHQYGHVQ